MKGKVFHAQFLGNFIEEYVTYNKIHPLRLEGTFWDDGNLDLDLGIGYTVYIFIKTHQTEPLDLCHLLNVNYTSIFKTTD